MTATRILGITAITLLSIAVIAVCCLFWVMNTQAGTRWALNLAGTGLNDAFQVQEVTGTLAGLLTLQNVSYRDPAAGIDLKVAHLALYLEALALLHATLHVADLKIDGVRLEINEADSKESAPQELQPFNLEPPIDIRVDRLQLANALVSRDSATLVQLDALTLIGAWTGDGVDLRQLDLRGPQGEAHLQARVHGDDIYEGDGEGSFEWTVGEREYAGTLQADANAETATLHADLTAPLPAQLQLVLQQREHVHWTLAVQVPQFDPRDEFMPDSSMRDISASLEGSGTLDEATFSGAITVNEQPLQIEKLHVQRSAQALQLQAVFHPPRGRLQADGEVLFVQEPASLQADLNWQDVVLPAAWVGQELHSAGQVRMRGSTENYAANGSLRLGPPERIASVELDLTGSTQHVELRQLDVVQKEGRLRANGQVDLQPALAWNLQAEANHFNPGEFIVSWPGDLNFQLASDGTQHNSGVEATARLQELSGELRGQPVRGQADMHLSPQQVLAGIADLRWGDNTLRLNGERGETMNARAQISIPALGALLPDAHGSVMANLRGTGRWPALSLDGQIDAESLQVSAARASRMSLTFDVAKLDDPQGSLTFDASDVAASGLSFQTLHAHVEGDAARHSLTLDATGQPLSTHLQLHGARNRPQPLDWQGTIEALTLDTQDVARLQLQQQVTVKIADGSVESSQLCLSDGQIKLCASGERSAQGTLRVDYLLNAVPLALANTFVPMLPVSLLGTLNGQGNLQLDDGGLLQGNAELHSDRGELARNVNGTATRDAPHETLLRYDNLEVRATMNGSSGEVQLSAALDNSGRLNGNLYLSGMDTGRTGLRGQIDATVPSIAVIKLFTPQLANVQGSLQMQASVSGSLDAPQLQGEARLSELASDIPALGLKLHEGQVSVTMRNRDEFALRGQIGSGDGTLRLEGTGNIDGAAQLEVSGQRFVAADIPGARVIVEPDLRFTRDAQMMSLDGQVLIPEARIDLQKLPQTDSVQNTSSDVVVMDATKQEEVEQEVIPLRAAIDVKLGDAVKLIGFGLDATVAGQLQVNEASGDPTTGSGEIRVAGTYKAYGQDLSIRQGQLLFAGTPLDNPRLSIVAVREAQDDVVAGLRIEGYASSPQLTVFSEPPMAQSNALAYLVTGKPLDEIGSGEGDAMQSAARSLGTAAGGLLAKNVGRRLGVDELGVEDNEMIGGAALTIGQYLSPRLYLSYGIGLFDPGEIVTLRYKVSDGVALKVLNGSEESRAGVEYRLEK